MMRRFILSVFLFISALLTIGLSAGFATGMYAMVQKMPVKQYFPTQYTNAVWDWKNPIGRNEGQMKDTAQWLYQHQVNTVYVDLGSIISGNNEERMNHALEAYITAMDAKKVKVFAAGGVTSWSRPENHKYPVQLMDYVYQYNEAHPAHQLSGIEFDVEAYNQEGFADASFAQKEVTLTEYLDMVDVIATKQEHYIAAHAGSNIELGFSVPYWFDNENKNIKSVTWLGKTGPTIYHLMDRLNKLDKTNVVVMSYRNAARGNDGSIAHARTEVEYAQYKASKVKVIMGQETTNVEPAKITFYGKSAAELSREMDWVKQEFAPTGVFGGIAINDLNGFMQLPDK